jgi:glycosyltransferase involved in cell wall biosynthesis
MNPLSKSSNHVVYVIGNNPNINHRLKGILSLADSFEKMLLLTRPGPRYDINHLTVRPYYNPLGILRLIRLHKIKKKLEKYLFFPSAQILYTCPVNKVLKTLVADDIENGKKVCIITCFPPHDLSFIGLSLKTKFPQIRWIADWQDLWSWDEYYFKRVSRLYQNRLLQLEHKILSMCDINITTNFKAKTILENHYRIPSSKVVAINHHFYPPDFPRDVAEHKNLNDFKNQSMIKIGFLGNLFKPPKVPGSKVVEVIKNLRTSGLNVALYIFGDQSDLAKEAANTYDNKAVVLFPRVTHKQSLLNLSKCDFFLLALSDSANSHIIMHLKLPHYLHLKRPIIAIVPQNSFVAQLVGETRSGHVIPTESNWERELKKIFTKYSSQEYNFTPDEKAIQKYSWDNIRKYWLQAIKSVPGKNSF